VDRGTYKLFGLVLSTAVLAGVVVWAWRCNRRPLVQPSPVNRVFEASTNPVAASPVSGGLDERLRLTAAGLASSRSKPSGQEQIARLRETLASLPVQDAVPAIRRFLDSKMDAVTGLGFKLGGHGVLVAAPTLRTFLLDCLGQLDPATAAANARGHLGRQESPHEGAIPLRNLARGDASPSGRALLEEKTAELLRYEPWQRDPSVGYLEAFDVAVYLGDTNFAPALGDLVRRPDNLAVAHAAYLALDRLIINDPVSLLATLEAAPQLMQGREATRADYFARADVRDPQQRQVLESYLLDLRRGAAELAQFAGTFPNANYMISQNLLTPTPTPDHASLTGRDAASLQVVQEWLADPRFKNLRVPLQRLKQRLDQFVQQAKGP
jgi:hypothetical protein